MGVSESLVLFAGFVFAHAAWNISDLPKDELLVPIVMTERAGERELMRFEADTQAEAIANAKNWIAKNGSSVDAWVFARDGRMRSKGVLVDAISIEAKAKGMSDAVIFVQRYQPFSKGKFKLLGEPTVAVGSAVVSDTESKHLLAQLLKGVHTHPKAPEFWKEWSKP